MTSFVVETYVPSGDPERFALDVDGIGRATEAIDVAFGRVHHVRSYLVPSDEMGFHVVEAERAQDVVRVTELAGIEVERIVEAIGIEPGRAEHDRTRSGLEPSARRITSSRSAHGCSTRTSRSSRS